MEYQPLLRELTDIGPRYAEAELRAAKIIEKHLKSLNIPFEIQPFSTEVPICTRAELTADGEIIECLGSSIVSGEIPDGRYLISQFGYSGDAPYNIAYSPVTDSICVAEHYKVPSVSISRLSVIKIAMAKDVKGFVEVERKQIDTENILVGNISNPKNIVFVHFDSVIGQGAVDNAGSVVVAMGCLENNRKILETGLFVFSGNEEVSYDEYQTDGYGFRVFEKKYGELINNATKIIVLDGIGIGEPSFTQDKIDWVLQLKMLDQINNKIFWLQNDQTPALQVFHTREDVTENLNNKYLLQAERLLTKKLLE